MKIAILILFFLMLGAFFIISNHNLALINPSNMAVFLSEYSSWFSNSVDNLKSITAFAIKQDWLP